MLCSGRPARATVDYRVMGGVSQECAMRRGEKEKSLIEGAGFLC